MAAAAGAAFKIGDGYIDVRLRDNTAGDLAAIRARLRGLDTDIEVGINDQTAADIARIRQRLRGLDTTATVRLNSKGAMGQLGGLSKSMLKILGIGAGGLLMTNSVASLGAAAVSAAGALLVLPAAGAAAAAAGATVAVGMTGVAEAFKQSGKDAAKYAEALKDLSPVAREFVQTTVALGPAWKALRLDVQDKLFAGLGASIKAIGGEYLPTLKTGMGGVATSLNLVAKDFSTFLLMPQTVRDTAAGFDLTARALTAARPGITGFSLGLRDIMAVGATFLPRLGAAFSDVGKRFADFMAKARASGQLAEWIDNGLTSLRQLGSIAGNVGSVLASMFRAAKQSGADFLGTLDRLTEQVAVFLRSGQGQTALVSLFREARAVIDNLTPGLMAAGRAAADFIASFTATGGLSQVATSISEIVTALSPLGAVLGSLAGDTLNNLAAGGSAAAAALSPLVSIFGGIVSGLGPVAPAALAAVVAFKGLGMLTPMLAAQGAAIAATAAKWGLYTTALTGSMAAGGMANTAVSRLGAVVTGLGRALPYLGVALIGVGMAAEKVSSETDKLSQAWLQGGSALQKARADYESFDLWWGGMWTDSADVVEQNAQKMYDSMTPLQQKQVDLKRATQEWNDALASQDPDRIAGAQQRLAAATEAAARAQDQQNAASKTAAQVMQDQIGAAQTLLGGMLQLDDALARVADAEKAANDAVKEHGAGSAEAAAAARDFAGAADQAARAAQAQAEAAAASRGANDAGAEGARVYGATLLQLAANASGPAQSALLGYIAKLDDAQLAALSAGAEASGFATKILTLPDKRTVKIAVDPETGKIISTQELLDAMDEKKTIVINGDTVPIDSALQRVLAAIALKQATVTINGQAMPAMEALQTVLKQADISKATVTINGQSQPAQGVLDAYIAAVNAGQGEVTINGQKVPADKVLAALLVGIDNSVGTATLDANDAPARAKLQAALAAVNTAHGIMTIDGDPKLANGKITAAVKFADGSKGTITVDGNEKPANGKITATVRYADGSTGTIKVDANAARANSDIDYAARDRSTTITATYRIVGSIPGLGAAVRGASGGIVSAMADGGMLGFAGGAVGGVSLTPMAGGIAQIVPPNSWRVIGDRLEGDESYIPIKRDSARSQSILETTAERMGRTMLPRQMPAAAASVTPTRASGGGWSAMVGEIRGLRADLANHGRTKGPVTVNVIQPSGSPAETGRMVALALRGTG